MTRFGFAILLLAACGPGPYVGPRAESFEQNCNNHEECLLVAETCDETCRCPTSAINGVDADAFSLAQEEYCGGGYQSGELCSCGRVQATCSEGACARCFLDDVGGALRCPEGM